MVKSAVLGFPPIGPKRETKFALEKYWADKISAEELLKATKDIRVSNLKKISEAGIDYVPSGDFTLYDGLLDHTVFLGALPKEYTSAGLSPLDAMFAAARGRQRDGIDLPALEMKKWFNSNYHQMTAPLGPSTAFKLVGDAELKPLVQYKEAKEAGVETRPVIIGPVSYLLLNKPARDVPSGFELISLLDKVLPLYSDLVSKLAAAGAKAIQVDEPILVLDSAAKLGAAYKTAYEAIAKAANGVDIVLTTYFGRLESNLDLVKDLPIGTLHVDLDSAPEQLDATIAALKSGKTKLSLGLVSGRNIWKADLKKVAALADKAIEALGEDRVIVATSSSLRHTPVTLANESKLTAQQKDWFSFATEKLAEVAALATRDTAAFESNAKSIAARRDFEATSDKAVRERLSKVSEADYKRKSAFTQRKKAQDAVHKLPLFPTTTIGSYPQTKEIRQARAKFTKGEMSQDEYDKFIEKEIEHVVRFQEQCGLDILVHGEPERNDMVQYFGEQLQGFVFTENAWVQSYGSRYVRPPIVVSDVSRPTPMTVRWSSYAQTLSKLPVKGMLTGPCTILAWSFPRVDVSRETQAMQLALALRDEVVDLEKAGIFAIQVDEPAIREMLPLRRSDWDDYLRWAVDSFRLSTAGVEDKTQTHSHFCYSDFNDIFSAIQRLDADVISIEASRSDLKLLDAFGSHTYQNGIGPGVYDIHSPRVPSQQEIEKRIGDMLKFISPDLLFINPDCGLKTRGWAETESSLRHVVEAAKWARQNHGGKQVAASA